MPHRSLSLCSSLFCIVFALLPHDGRAQGTAGEVALSDESLQLRYLMAGTGFTGTAGELGFGLFLSENRDIVISSHYYMEADRLRFDRLSFKAGPVGYAALLSIENADVFSVAVGAEVRFELLRRQELFVVGRAAYAPDILTFGSADNLIDLTAQLELALSDQVVGLVGYRLLDFDLLAGDGEIEESAQVGVRYRF